MDVKCRQETGVSVRSSLIIVSLTCPAALAKPNVTILASIDGCLSMKPKNAMPSPVTTRPTEDKNNDCMNFVKTPTLVIC